MKRHFPLSLGAELIGAEKARFRLWAPSVNAVELVIADRASPMARNSDGIFELVSRGIAGEQYGFRINGGPEVPDPASRFQAKGVHNRSELINPLAFEWSDDTWRGRPWKESLIYELHVGAFTREGSFAAAVEHLDQLAELGVTAIELMPLAASAGDFGWGYDGVLPFAPDAKYGRPDDLRRLIQECHRREIQVFLDVVYNHLGPEGNYLHLYAAPFFTERHHTPWGPAFDFDGAASRIVRRYFVENALYWLIEYGFDGLRLDAVDQIVDDSVPDILDEIATTIRARIPERAIHLVLENDRNEARRLVRGPSGEPALYSAQWNDDVHHALHVTLTGQHGGYYGDFESDPVGRLGRGLAEGFAYQGEPSPHRGFAPRGESSAHLPPTAMVDYLQNHDQVGNRPGGERITALASDAAVRAAAAINLLSPSIPLLFMGEEWAASTPFFFFCDLEPGLADAVRGGRRGDYLKFAEFRAWVDRDELPDPLDRSTFDRSKLEWDERLREPHRSWLTFYQSLISIRREHIVPRLSETHSRIGAWAAEGTTLSVRWDLGDSRLDLVTNLAARETAHPPLAGELLWESEARIGDVLPPWYVRFALSSPSSPSP